MQNEAPEDFDEILNSELALLDGQSQSLWPLEALDCRKTDNIDLKSEKVLDQPFCISLEGCVGSR